MLILLLLGLLLAFLLQRIIYEKNWKKRLDVTLKFQDSWIYEGEKSALKEVDKGLIEAAKSFGASDFQIIFKVMIKEAMPSIVSGITLSTISILGYTAMAGAVGAGGLGAVALTYGYQKFDTSVMLYTVLILIVIVQLIQCIGNLAYKKLK